MILRMGVKRSRLRGAQATAARLAGVVFLHQTENVETQTRCRRASPVRDG